MHLHPGRAEDIAPNGSYEETCNKLAATLQFDHTCFSSQQANEVAIYITPCSLVDGGGLRTVHIARWAHMHLSVCLSLDNNSYLGKYYSYESETLPQYKALIGAYRKNTRYTLGSIFLINEKLGSSYLGK